VKRALLVVLLAPALAGAQVARYNDPAAAPPLVGGTLAAQLTAAAVRAAQQQHRAPLVADARLAAAALTIARSVSERSAPSNDLVSAAGWLQGIVDPPPHLIITAYAGGSDGTKRLLAELPNDLAPALASERYGRVGVGVVAEGDETRVVIALQQVLVELEPVARAWPRDAVVRLRGKLHASFSGPEAFVTAPDGKVLTRMPLKGHGAAFDGSFRCGPDPGRYQVEVTAADQFGETVLANFPIWCGAPAARTLAELVPPQGDDDSKLPPPQAERAVWKLLNADRAHAGLPPLAWDDALAAVARGHSADMAAHNFFGHISPTTGSAVDRVRKVGIDYMVVMENLARAFSPREAERSLMTSPGHRANILSKDATRVGVGIVADPRTPGLLVTQLFSKPPEQSTPGTVAELRKVVASIRKAKRRAPLEPDDSLDRLAQATASGLASHQLDTESAARRIHDDFQRNAAEWRYDHAAFGAAGAVSQLAGAASLAELLDDPLPTHVGLAVETVKRPEGGSALQFVVIVATRR
jgi:uncharacterized protein YkwD